MKVFIDSYNWHYKNPNVYQMVLRDGHDELEELLFYHCFEVLEDGRDRVNDSKRNRDLITGLLKAHGVDVCFTKDL